MKKEFVNMTTGEIIAKPSKLKAFIYFYKDSKKYKYRVKWCDVKPIEEFDLSSNATY